MPGTVLTPGAAGAPVNGTWVHYPPGNSGLIATWDASGAIYSSAGWVDIWAGSPPSAVSASFSGLISGYEIAEHDHDTPSERLFVVPVSSGGTWTLQVRAQSGTGPVLASTPWDNTGQRITLGYDGTYAYIESGTMFYQVERQGITASFFCFPSGPLMRNVIVGTWPLTSSSGTRWRNPLNGPAGAALTTTNGGGDPWTLIVGSSVYSADYAFSGSVSAVATSDTASHLMKAVSGAQRRVKGVVYVYVPAPLPTPVEPSVLMAYTLGTPTSAVASRIILTALNTTSPKATLTTRGTPGAAWVDRWTGLFPLGRWVRVEMDLDAGTSRTTGSARVRLYDGDDIVPMQDSTWITGVDTAGLQGCIGDVRGGTVQGVWIDHLGVADGELATDDPWPSNYAPVVTLTPDDQLVPSGERWRVDAAVVEDQAVASVVWDVQVTVGGVTLPVTSGLTGQGTTTLTGDGSTTGEPGSVLTITCTVTDTGGLVGSATTRVVVREGPLLPVREPTTREILYGGRETAYRFEVLSHDAATGTDSLSGYLDGVESGSLQWADSADVKGAGSLVVHDLASAAPGMTRIGDINLVTARIRPVLLVTGLPEVPLGVFVITAAPETWESEGRTYQLELHDKCSVLDQDATDAYYVAPTTERVLKLVQDIVESCGEALNVSAAETATLPNEKVWDPGTSKLELVNDLLEAIGYSSLWADGQGNLRATATSLPADRPTRYDVLGMEREIVDGPESIYVPSWTRDIDSYGVPNRVFAFGSGTADDEPPPAGVWTNEDPASPYSYQARGRWITHVLTGQDVADGTQEQQTAALAARARATLIAMSSPVAAVEVKHLPLPLVVGDVVRFASQPAGIDARHYVSSLQLELSPVGYMTSTLREVQAL